MSGGSIDRLAWDILQRHVVKPLVRHCLDMEYGGFLTDLDERWRPVGPQNKSLEHATRTTIVFAQLAKAMPGQDFERFVRHGCQFLQQKMWDEAHGGFYARVDRSGEPLWDGMKHPHAVTYAARTFLMSAPFLPPNEGLTWARRALGWLEHVAWDQEHGGYWGTYRRDNQRYGDGVQLPTPDGRDIFGLVSGFKETNTQGDGIEMLAEFAIAEPGAGHDKTLLRTVELVMRRLIQPHGILPYRFLRDWTPAPDLIRVGYQFLMARHLLVASQISSVPQTLPQVRELVDFCLRSATHPAGGFCFAVSADGRAWPGAGLSSDLRYWWVEIEAIYVLHVLATSEALDPDVRIQYRRAFDEHWRFFCAKFLDERNGGVRGTLPAVPHSLVRTIYVWLQRIAAPGGTTRYKSHCWKDTSHETVALLALSKGQ